LQPVAFVRTPTVGTSNGAGVLVDGTAVEVGGRVVEGAMASVGGAAVGVCPVVGEELAKGDEASAAVVGADGAGTVTHPAIAKTRLKASTWRTRTVQPELTQWILDRLEGSRRKGASQIRLPGRTKNLFLTD
jgi:hypothetical protein